MAALISPARRTGTFPWLIGPTLVLALLVGCTHTQKSSPAKSPTPHATAKHATAEPPAAKPAPTANANKPAQRAQAAAKPVAAPVAAEKLQTGQATDEPPARKTSEAAPAQAAQSPNWPIPQDRPMTEQERDALAQMIRAAAEEGQKRQAAEQAQPKPEAKPPTGQPAAAGKPAKKEGCGASGNATVDLNPPSPDKPQPKFECKQKKIVADDVWQGKMAQFKFTLTNAGEGPLAIRIKKP
jgi:hypothetical protein